MRPTFFHHLHPPTIPAAQARLRYTLGAGGISFFLFFVVMLSGVLELFYYIPTPEQAALSVQTITYLVPFGGFVRNLHYWSAQLLVLAVVLHGARVILSGAYGPPRRLNYLIGFGLLVLCLALDFSGYLLRWDQGVQWAIAAGTNLLRSIPLAGDWFYRLAVGSDSLKSGILGGAALVRFYGWHIFGLALPAVIFTGWHIFRIRRDGGIAAPPIELQADPMRITRFELVGREIAAALICGSVISGLAVFSPAPIAPAIPSEQGALASPAAALTTSSTSRSDSQFQNEFSMKTEPYAPWFFLWIQQLLKLGSPLIFGIVVPVVATLLIASIPYIFKPPPPQELGRWLPPSGRAAQVLLLLIAMAIFILTVIARFSPN